MSVHESELNIKIASILSEAFGIDCRAERTQRRARPDIRCFYNGLRVVLEASYSARDAENDAKRRVEEGLADIALALHYRQKYPDVPEKELENMLKGSEFDVMVVVPRELGAIESYLLGKTRVAEPRERWFRGVRLEVVVDFIKHAVAYIIEEKEVRQEVERIKQAIGDFINTANNVKYINKLREGIVNVLYRLYGFTVAEATNAEIIFGQAALAILLSAVFYERVRHAHGLQSLRDYTKSQGAINGLRTALEELLKIDYEPALKLAIEILSMLPPDLGIAVKNLVDHALRISEMSHLLARDFAGRIYHEVTGDIAVRKGFATFYTEVPAAYMLTNLALRTVLGIESLEELTRDKAKNFLEAIQNLKIADFACGSGTLLTASLYNASRIMRTLCFTHDIDCPDVEKKLVEEGIYGLDALRYAAQITAINLALMSPSTIGRENVNAVYLGYIQGKGAWLGSLELLDNGRRVGGLLRWIEGGLKGVAESISVANTEGGEIKLLDSYDVVIMNPPFTRATGRISEEFEEGRRGLFGFIADENAREKVKDKYEELRDRVREDLIKVALHLIETEPILHRFWGLVPWQKKLGKREGIGLSDDLRQFLSIGQAGEGLLFLYLAYRYVKPGGVVAFVLPRNILHGVSWFLARMLLADKFHLKHVIISSDGKRGFNFSEGANFSEVLIVAKRVDNHTDSEETYFIELFEKPETAFEGLLYADGIVDSIVKSPRDKCTSIAVKDRVVARVRKICRRDLLSFIINWGPFFMEEELLDLLRGLLEESKLGSTDIPIIKLGNLVIDMGVNRGGDVIEAFNLIVRGRRVDCEAYRRAPKVPHIPMVCGSGEEVARTIEISPNAYVPDVTNAKAERIKRLRTRLLIPNRIRWNTFHAVAHLVTEPAISNVYFMVKTELDEKMLKALVLWLNSFWGLLSVYSLMEVTEEAFTRLNIGQWKLIPVLDVKKLSMETLMCLSNVYDQHKNNVFGPIIDQFKSYSRLQLDLDIMRCLGIKLNKDLEKLYNIFYFTLSRMSRRHG